MTTKQKTVIKRISETSSGVRFVTIPKRDFDSFPAGEYVKIEILQNSEEAATNEIRT